MSSFDHYHDMDHDGDRDLKDSGMFHVMEDHHVGQAGEDEFYILCKGLLIVGGIILALVMLFT